MGFYGLDLYSLDASMDAVVAYLQEHDPEAAARARRRYACLQPYASDSADYGRALLRGVGEPCRRAVIEQLVELRRRAGDFLVADGLEAEDEQFFAEQNAVVVADAEEYYRGVFGDRAGTWNLRDRHMADTLDALMAHLDRHGGTARVVVWAHNSHVGDARATDAAARGELTIGQLLRERHGPDVVPVGFTTDRRDRDRRRRLGRAGRAHAPSAGRCPTATRRCCTPAACPPSCCARCPAARRGGCSASRAWSGRSASCTARRPSARATTSPRA